MSLARALGDDVTGAVLLDHPRRSRLRMRGHCNAAQAGSERGDGQPIACSGVMRDG